MNRGQRKTFVTIALIVVSVIAALVIEVVDGAAGGAATPSSSSTGSSHGSANLTAPSAGGAATGAGVGAGKYRTVGTHVNLRAGASTDTSVITVLVDLGSPVTLSCYLRGTSVAGDPWWYRANFVNASGYVAGYWVNTGPDPAKTHLPAC